MAISKPIKKIVIFLAAAICMVTIVTKLNHIDSRVHAILVSKNPFSPTNISCELGYDPEYDVKTSPELVAFVNVLTQQPFRWLSKGFQAYAFESQDGEYVIKFFQQSRLQPHSFMSKPFEYLFNHDFRQRQDDTVLHRREILSSSKISFEEIAEETGIIFVHLNKTDGLLHGVRVVDSLGQSYKIKPDTACFLIQRKATYILPTLTELLKKGDIDGAKARIHQVFDLLFALAKKGMVDSDYALIRNNNIGFVASRAIYIDTGHITKHVGLNVYERMKYEFSSRLKPLREWIRIRHPELLSYYDSQRDEMLATVAPEKASTVAVK